MKATVAAVLLAGVMGLGLSGCIAPPALPGPSPTPSSSQSVELGTPEATPETTEPPLSVPTRPRAAPSPQPDVSATLSQAQLEEVFLSTIHKQYPQYNDSREDLLGLADTVCLKLDQGVSPRALISTIDPNASNRGYLAFIIGAGVGTFCPEYADAFRAQQ